MTIPPRTASQIANVPAGNIAATNVQTALNELDTEKASAQFLVDINRQGFLSQTETTLSFAGTTLTLTDAGAGWSYYRAGIKYTISGNKSVALSASTAGIYYIYIDATDGTLTCSAVDTPWTLTDTKIPVATVQYNSTLTPTYWLADERHTCLIDWRMQYIGHTADGAHLTTVPTISGQTLNTDTDAAKACGISSAVLVDQDIIHSITALTDPEGLSADYAVFYRTSTTTWAWKLSIMPFNYTAAGYINYDNSGTSTQGTTAKFYNSYLMVTNKTGAARYTFFSGRAEFASLAAAQSENVAGFSFAGVDVDEAVIAYRFTWETNASYASTGKCRLAATPQVLDIAVVGATIASSASHNGLSGLQGGTANEYYHLTSSEYTGTGTGNFVRATSPTLTTPVLGTPSSGTLSNCSGLPWSGLADRQLAENAPILLDAAGSADGKYSGIAITGVSGYAQAFGDLVTLDKDDSRWEAVDISVAAAATGDARGILGMVVSAGTDGNACTILLSGTIRADANFPALTIGAAVYASTTGDIVVTQPTTTDYVIRIVGYALTADEIFFQPAGTWTTHT